MVNNQETRKRASYLHTYIQKQISKSLDFVLWANCRMSISQMSTTLSNIGNSSNMVNNWNVSCYYLLYKHQIVQWQFSQTQIVGVNLILLSATSSADITLFINKRLCSTKCSSKTLQNLLYFMYYKKTHVVFFVFHFVQLYIFTL